MSARMETAEGSGSRVTQEDIYEALRGVIDPEIGINVVDLGLIYGVEVSGGTVDITMTMTTPGCPLHQAITRGAQTSVCTMPGVEEVQVHLVWSPPWEPTMMSEAARNALG